MRGRLPNTRILAIKERIAQYLGVIECQWRESIDGPPFGLGSIVEASNWKCLRYVSNVSHSNGTTTWITVDCRIGSNLFNLPYLKSCLFFEFASGTLFSGLVHVHKATRECPTAFEGFTTSLNQ
jgi:hypothetical protein